jgi:hypothetical protein
MSNYVSPDTRDPKPSSVTTPTTTGGPGGKYKLPPPPPKKGVTPPKTTATGATVYGAKLSYADIRALWIAAGGDESVASTMAAIAMAESGGTVSALNDNASTGDHSVGLWQINYFGDLAPDRIARYGSPKKLRNDPLANAKAAVDLYKSGGFQPWANSYGNGDGPYKAYVREVTPEEQAAAAARANRARQNDSDYVPSTTDLSLAKEADKAWKTDPWVTVDKKGHISQHASPTAPPNTLKYGGQPLTQSSFQSVWTQGYADTFEAYTGRNATGPEIKKILSEGVTPYALSVRLAESKDFVKSRTFKQHAPGVAQYVKEKLGRRPNAKKIGQIIAENWDPATLDAWIKKQPGYMNGPEYQTATANLRPVYEQIMGKPDERGEAYIHDAAVNGWTQDALANNLRNDPSYDYSPEYQAKAVNFLDAMGMYIGARPVLKIDPSAKKKQQPQLPLKLDTGDGIKPPLPYQATFRRPV